MCKGHDVYCVSSVFAIMTAPGNDSLSGVALHFEVDNASLPKPRNHSLSHVLLFESFELVSGVEVSAVLPLDPNDLSLRSDHA